MEKKISFEAYVPQPAFAYCDHLHNIYKFDFLLSRPRQSRLGDFTVRPGFVPRITVNKNLNPYNFLITYLHEVAHHVVYTQTKSRGKKQAAPHGLEWKREFEILLIPVMNGTIFPADILEPLLRYAKNPKASTSGDPVLYQAIKKYDDHTLNSNKVALIHLLEGSHFVFHNRQFVKGTLRRTRVLCIDKASQRRYTIPAHALVEAC
jgi:SprT protein